MSNKIVKVTNDKIPHMRTSVWLPRLLYAEARRLLVQRGMSFNDFVNQKIRDFVKNNASH